MKKALLCIVFLNTSVLFSQIFKNSNGEGVFFTEKAKQFGIDTEFSKKTTSLNFQLNSPLSFWLKKGASIKYYNGFKKTNKDEERDSVKVFTLQTSFSLLTEINLVNTQTITKGLVNPEVGIKLGIIKTIDSLNRNELSTLAWSGGITSSIKYDNKKVFYDTISNVKTTKYPYTYSIDLNAEFYFKNLKFMALGTVVGYNNSTNYADLKAFQDLPFEFMDSNIAIIGEDEDGRVGSYNRKGNFYLGLSAPIFPFKLIKEETTVASKILERVVLTPYIHKTFRDSDILNIGASISLVDVALNNNSFTELFNTGFSVGFDWVKKENKWSSLNVFIGGKLSIDGLIKHFKPVPE
ncbi:hypothetical protein [Tenacibaculum sp.]|uniref:hypothetical protein n=1 Tax=Tenacibaculum sp. TaxID=1906242 RepID=UPI003AA974BA